MPDRFTVPTSLGGAEIHAEIRSVRYLKPIALTLSSHKIFLADSLKAERGEAAGYPVLRTAQITNLNHRSHRVEQWDSYQKSERGLRIHIQDLQVDIGVGQRCAQSLLEVVVRVVWWAPSVTERARWSSLAVTSRIGVSRH